LTTDDVNMNDGSIAVKHGKGGKQRIVHIGTKAQKALWKYLAVYRNSESKSLFINKVGEPLDVVGVKILVKRLGGARQSQRITPQAALHVCYQLPARWR
jgi:site-specific recombinase XerD